MMLGRINTSSKSNIMIEHIEKIDAINLPQQAGIDFVGSDVLC